MPNLTKQPRPTDKQTIRRAWADELNAGRQARATGDSVAEWAHLERAHILSQPLTIAHIRTHLAMLGYGIRHHDRREITGQMTRLLVAGPGSAIRRYPLGNTGGAGVSATAPMPIPADLQPVLNGGVEVAS
jgi:hypothetical protein